MKLSTIKTLEEMRPVLKNPQAVSPEELYFVFRDISETKWASLTIINHDRVGEEYSKTFGHYHGVKVNEIMHIQEGQGVLQLVQKDIKDGEWDPAKPKAVYLLKAKMDDEIIVTPEYGHSWSNIGPMPLILLDDWRSGHSPSDYEDIKNLHGMPYYLVEKNGEPKAMANPNYNDLPEPIWITAEEFAKSRQSFDYAQDR